MQRKYSYVAGYSWHSIYKVTNYSLYDHHDSCKHIAICGNDVRSFLPHFSFDFGKHIFVFSFALYFDEDNEHAFPTFIFNLLYFLIFAALLIDHYLI